MRGLTEELAGLESQSMRRTLQVVSQREGPRLTVGGQTLLNFASNNYLGLARHPSVLDAVKQVLDHWGAGASSSRLISGTSIVHQDFEGALAAFLSRESALLFPSGYMANLGVIASLAGPGDAVVMDRLCHASLLDAVRLAGARLFVYRHKDADQAERALKRARSFRRRLLVTESLFSMDGDFAPVARLVDLARRYEATSVIDDAHAFGVWGEGGRGLSSGSDIVVGTLSKALGSQGGFAAASREIIELLINNARSFIFTTGLSPMCVAAAQAALSLIQEDTPHPIPSPLCEGRGEGEGRRARLDRLSSQLRNGLQTLGYDTLHSESQIVPILLGDAKRALSCSDHLRRGGLFAPAIRPPTVHAGECRIRFSLTSEHQEADIQHLMNILKEWSL